MHEAEGGPITRAARATWFAVSLAGVAAEIARALSQGRNVAEAAVHVEPNPIIIQVGADPALVVLTGGEPTAAARLYISMLPDD